MTSHAPKRGRHRAPSKRASSAPPRHRKPSATSGLNEKLKSADFSSKTWKSSAASSKIPVTVAALALVAGTFVPFGNSDKGIAPSITENIIAAGNSVSNPRADKGKSIDGVDYNSSPNGERVEESTASDVADVTVIPSVVDYYRKACVPLAPAVDVSNRISIATETSIGQNLEDKKNTHATALEVLVGDLFKSADSLGGIEAPVGDIPGSSELTAATYEAAVKSTTGSMRALAEALREFPHHIREADSPQKLAEIETKYKSTINKTNPALTEALNNLVGTAGAVTAGTGDAVRKLEECSHIFKPSPLPEDSVVVEPAVDLHVRIKEAENILDGGNAKINSLYSDTEGKTFTEGKTAAVAAWDARADAADKALNHILAWKHPANLSAADENALRGYDQIRDDAVKVYTEIRDVTRDQSRRLSETTTPTELNNALTPASDAIGGNNIALLKLGVRVDRVASPPTTATADAIQKRLENPPAPPAP